MFHCFGKVGFSLPCWQTSVLFNYATSLFFSTPKNMTTPTYLLQCPPSVIEIPKKNLKIKFCIIPLKVTILWSRTASVTVLDGCVRKICQSLSCFEEAAAAYIVRKMELRIHTSLCNNLLLLCNSPWCPLMLFWNAVTSTLFNMHWCRSLTF